MNIRKFILGGLLVSVVAHAGFADSWNLRTNPTGWVVGPNLRLDYKVGSQLTFGLLANSIDRKLRGVKIREFSPGLVASYSFREAFVHSWFVDFGVRYGKIKGEVTDVTGQLDQVQVANTNLRLLIGYHWFWGRFNLSVGAGAESNSAGGTEILDASGAKVDTLPLSKVGFASDASLGVTF